MLYQADTNIFLTYNKAHFVRFAGIVIISPAEVVSSQSTPGASKNEEKDEKS
jgi:hypothetical protein